MNEFRAFDSLDEMFTFLAEQEKVANSNILPKQREITWGSYWVRPTDDGVLVWGRVHTEEEILTDEDEWVIIHEREMHERGYRFGVAHSLWCPEGELGSSHISVLWPITEEQFNNAKAAGWNPGSGEKWFQKMLLEIIHSQEGEGG